LWPRFRYRLSEYDSLTWKVKGMRAWPSELSWLASARKLGDSCLDSCTVQCCWSSIVRYGALVPLGHASRYVEILNSVWWLIFSNLVVWSIIFDMPSGCPLGEHVWGSAAPSLLVQVV
jgi:hypothetical protein